MKKLCIPLFVALLSIQYFTGCSNLPKRSADFDEVSSEMNELAVLPATFQIQEVGAFSSELESEMNYDIEKEIKKAVKAVIEESQIDLARLDTSDEVLRSAPELRRAIFDHTAAIADAHKAIAESDGKVIDVKYQGNIDAFADLSDCDCFVYVEGTGYFKTGGAVAKDIALASIFAVLFGSQPTTEATSATTLSGYIIDANRGRVVWYNEKTRAGSDPRKPTHILESVQDLFKPLFGQSKIRWDEDQDNEIIDKYEEQLKEMEENETDQSEEET